MKKMLIALMVAFSALSIAVSEAEAKRMGGGGSFGKQSQGLSRSAPSQSSNQAATAPKPAAPAAATPQTPPPQAASPWRGILGGALVGLGLGALMSHLGLGGALGSIIGSILMIALLAVAAMFIIRMFRRRHNNNGNAPAYAGGYASGSRPEIGSRIEPDGARPSSLQSMPDSAISSARHTDAQRSDVRPQGVPADFDVEAFLRNAKTYFLRLQAAWDRGDVNDIREFTTPEMFAELKMQLQERGVTPNHTNVVSLDAELLGLETVGDEYLASVSFSGLIKEAENAPAEPFSEVWNLSKPISGQGGWVLAGIQQLA